MPWQDIFQIRIAHGYIIQLLIAEALFLPVLTKRKYFIFRAAGAIALFSFLSVIITNLVYMVAPGMNSLVIFLLSLPMCAFCFKNRFQDVLFCCVGAQLIQNVAHNIENIIYLPLADNFNDIGWFFLSISVMLLIYAAFFYIVIRRLVNRNEISLESYGVYAIAIFSALFCYMMQFLLQVYKIDVVWVTRLPLVLCGVISLMLQFGLLGYKRKLDENYELERLIERENKYYETMINNIDVVNMKAHDLKHFISELQEGGYADSDELAEIQTAVEQYEHNIKTGNKVLDVVLTEKSYLARNDGIAFSMMVQGGELDFMRSGDLTSLFGNIIDNAIEYERTVADRDKRCILLKVFRKGELILIHAENYCVTDIEYKNDLPKTTKGSNDYHGYGLKSVRYVAKKYGGNVNINRSGDLFVIDVVLPVPTQRQQIVKSE